MTNEDALKAVMETSQRTIRIETRLMRLCSALNVDPTDGKVRIIVLSPMPRPMVEVAGYDVSYGDLLAFCRKSGINGIVTVMCRSKVLGSVMAPAEQEEAHASP